MGISLKMYLGHRATLDWTRAVVDIARADPGVSAGRTTVALLPTFVSLDASLALAAGTPVAIGAQDLFWEDNGAFTGEVSGQTLAEIGCGYVEIGHAERRSLFGEDEGVVARKLAAAARNGLAPILCVGEPAHGSAASAAAVSIAQLRSALSELEGTLDHLVVAYEPVWAIGAAKPADPEHVRAVCREIRAELDSHPRIGRGTVIYGGSAGPGVLDTLGEDVDGLFLGRFAHDPEALRSILVEADAQHETVSPAH
ncbi:triose-phosphate isomerase family protein [Mycetocola spongiae]|uniref:triose-phosphate isomerase family protein n=1 Tax=Mycetocola spongiae TaxID=2859226 RepID=UPI0021F45B17|nr:triose-phosphate isomerase family protein [Mycetocola spongiae]